MTRFSRAAFLAAAAAPAQFPPDGPPEIAFLGRSNVGKSSAINALAGRKRLAFSSKTPGRTRTVNFYDLGGGRLVDLPGYGYARASKADRSAWDKAIGAYLNQRRTLAGAVILMDARHPFTASDAQLFEWLKTVPVPRLCVLTKADKLTRAERDRISKAFPESLLFSSRTGEGVGELAGRLEQWLREGLSRRRE